MQRLKLGGWPLNGARRALEKSLRIAETLVGVGDLAVPISQLGPESLSVLSSIEFNVAEVFNYGRKIDVYAKPAVKAPEPVRKAQAKPVARPQQAVQLLTLRSAVRRAW